MTAELDAMATVSLGAVLMIWARLLPVAVLLPCLGSAPAPPSARLALALGVSTLALAVLAGATLAAPDPSTGPAPMFAQAARVLALDPWQRALALGREFLAGALIGFAVSLIFWAGSAGFRLLGLALAGARSQVDDAMARLGLVLGVASFFAIDGPPALVRALAASYRALPLGAPWPVSPVSIETAGERPMLELVALSARVVDIALALAAPVLVATMLAHLALALLSRVHPGVRIAALARPVAQLIGLAVAALALFGMAAYWAAELGALPELVHHLLGQSRASL